MAPVAASPARGRRCGAGAVVGVVAEVLPPPQPARESERASAMMDDGETECIEICSRMRRGYVCHSR